jgi:hypothetical protein
VQGLKQAALVAHLQLPASSPQDSVLTVRIQSQNDPSVNIEHTVRVGVQLPEPITPRDGTTADLSIVLDAHYRMGDKLHLIADALEHALQHYQLQAPSDTDMVAWLSQFDASNPLTEAVYHDFLQQLRPDNPPQPPVIELITFTDNVTTRIVTDNLGEVIGRIRGLRVSDSDTCALAAVEAVEYAATNLNPHGQLFLAVASTPKRDMETAIQTLQQLGIKTHVLLAETCDQSSAAQTIAAYQHLSEATGGIFRTMLNNDESDLAVLNALVQEAVTRQGVCRIYGLDDGAMNNSQLFALEAQTLEVSLIGERHHGYDLEALAVAADSGRIYAISGDNADLDKPRGYFYEITPAGKLIPIGPTGFREIGDLTFANGVLYGHATNHGLVTLDPSTGTATLIQPLKAEMSALTAVTNSSDLMFYAVADQQLWQLNLSQASAEPICSNLPTEVEALEQIGDVLLFGTHHDATSQIQAFDPVSCQVVASQSIQLPDLTDIEGLAWDHGRCR